MSRPAKATDEEITLRVPKSALTVVAPPPATVTQRNCLDVFGISRADFLRMAGRDFPVTTRGQLRIARYADVEAALTSDAGFRKKDEPAAKRLTMNDRLDYSTLLRDAGARPERSHD